MNFIWQSYINCMKKKTLYKEQVDETEIIFRKLSKEIKFILDENNKISYISDNVSDILGFESSKMVGSDIFDFIESKENLLYCGFTNADNTEVCFIHENGSKIYMELQVKTVYCAKNKCSKKYGTMINISKYSDIINREGNLKVVFDNAKDIIYTVFYT